tara:strand:- start:1472 stop:1684 length:213 start_codon:yes stop_codon:yes gene_type:complete
MKCSLDIFERTDGRLCRLSRGPQDELGLKSFLWFVSNDYEHYQHHTTHQDHARKTTVSLQNVDQDFVLYA